MKKKYLILPLLGMILVGCRKTDESFEHGRYNSSNFDNNYYTEWNGVDKVEIDKTTTILNPFYVKEVAGNFGEYDFEVKNLIKEEDRFSYGYLSKLYDGRLTCDGYYTLSRVQLNKTGYGTFFPREYHGSESFGFALRGGTTIPDNMAKPKHVKINATFSFYIRKENTSVYDRVNIVFENLDILTDRGGDTTYVLMPFTDTIVSSLYGADAMSFNYELVSGQYSGFDITDDYTSDPNKEKEHFCVMLYEVLLPQSTWY